MYNVLQRLNHGGGCVTCYAASIAYICLVIYSKFKQNMDVETIYNVFESAKIKQEQKENKMIK